MLVAAGSATAHSRCSQPARSLLPRTPSCVERALPQPDGANKTRDGTQWIPVRKGAPFFHSLSFPFLSFPSPTPPPSHQEMQNSEIVLRAKMNFTVGFHVLQLLPLSPPPLNSSTTPPQQVPHFTFLYFVNFVCSHHYPFSGIQAHVCIIQLEFELFLKVQITFCICGSAIPQL